jgi:DNA-binding transcriptional LysR family regulator
MAGTCWGGLTVRHLETLQAIAEERTLGRAADRLGYMQSAVSQQLAALERIVGRRLVRRGAGRREVALTDAGEVLLGHGSLVLCRLGQARSDIEALGGPRRGVLRVGTFQSVAARVVPDVLPSFAARWPDTRVELREATGYEELLPRLAGDELDLAFVELPVAHDELEAVEVLADPWALIVPAGRRFVPRSVDALDGRPMLAFRTCRQLDRFLDERALRPEWVVRSDDNGTLLGLVAGGAGVALMPRLAVDRDDERTVVVELDDAPPPRRIGIAWHAGTGLSPCAAGFVETVSSVCAAMSP